MDLHRNRYSAVTHYVVEYATGRAILGPMTSRDAVDWIIARGDIEAQSLYVNFSRYRLAKKGLYPNNAQGEEKLKDDLG